MPIYDFQCSSCGFKDELMRKSSDSSTIACPQCQVESFSKMLSAPSFQLSGSGWYATDFKDKKPQSQSEKIAETGVSSAPKSTADSATTSKSAAPATE